MKGNIEKGEKIFKSDSNLYTCVESNNKIVIWSNDNLDKFLENPKKFMPDTKMAFSGLKKKEDREDVIAYLETLCD